MLFRSKKEEKKKVTYTAATAGGQWKAVGKKKRSGKGPATKIWSPEQRCFEIPRDLSRPSRLGRNSTSKDLARLTASVQTDINKGLRKMGADARI